MLGNRLGDGQDVAQVGRSIFVRRRTHRDKANFGADNGLRGIRGENQPAVGIGGFDQRLQTRLKYRNIALAQACQFGLVNIYTSDLVARIGQHGALDQTDIASAKNSDFHNAPDRIAGAS